MNAEMPIAVIIDDDADIRTLLDRVLTQSGFQTVLTANAFDGVAAVEEFSPLVTMLECRCRAWTASPPPARSATSATPTW